MHFVLTSRFVAYGLRGLAYFEVSIKGPGADLHSGVFGGMVHEPMTDLVAVLGRLVTPDGKILVPGINENVAPLTDEEKARYEVIDVTVSVDHKTSRLASALLCTACPWLTSILPVDR